MQSNSDSLSPMLTLEKKRLNNSDHDDENCKNRISKRRVI
ncbi:Uncharacterised protein [Turicibacter sanguinis]|nr:Uncharacterised protein [Turicibacter sanguinis]